MIVNKIVLIVNLYKDQYQYDSQKKKKKKKKREEEYVNSTSMKFIMKSII